MSLLYILVKSTFCKDFLDNPAMSLVHCDFKSETSHFHLEELQSKALSSDFNTKKPIGVFLITVTTISFIYTALF